MKFLAHRKSDGSDTEITIYDVIKGRNSDNPELWEEGKRYYSLWYHKPMKAVVNVTEKKPHFAFISGNAAGHSKGGESIEHELSKKIISELKLIKIFAYGKHYEVPILKSKLENPENFRDRNYRIDVLLEAESCLFTEEYGSTRIGIEVNKSSKVKSRKKHAIRNIEEKTILLEISLFNGIKFSNSNDVKHLYNRLAAYWKKEKKAKVLHNPNYKNYQDKVRRQEIKEERDRVKSQNLSKENNFVNKKPVELTPQRDFTPPIVENVEEKTQPKKSLGLLILTGVLLFFIVVMFYWLL